MEQTNRPVKERKVVDWNGTKKSALSVITKNTTNTHTHKHTNTSHTTTHITHYYITNRLTYLNENGEKKTA